MTITKPLAPAAPPGAQFPEMPPRGDMQNIIYLHRPGHITALIRHLGAPDTTLVLGEMPIGWITGPQEGLLNPDIIVAFGVDRDAIMSARGYAVAEREKSPDFVLEVASIHTARNDITYKRDGYAAYGVSEYWRFDPTGGRYYRTGLAGDRLVNGEYQPIAIHQADADRYWGHSDTLNLDLCWEYGELRWYDPVNERYLPTHDDEADGRMIAEADLVIAQTERDAERSARRTAEASIAEAEAGREAAEASIAEAEAGREAAEASIAEAEAGREAAEASIAEAEAGREAAETRRIAAEAQRDDAETRLTAAEARRTDAEAQRDDAETRRIAAESQQAAAEARHAAAVARKRELEAEIARLRNLQPPAA